MRELPLADLEASRLVFPQLIESTLILLTLFFSFYLVSWLDTVDDSESSFVYPVNFVRQSQSSEIGKLKKDVEET